MILVLKGVSLTKVHDLGNHITEPCFVIGSVLWLLGFFANLHSDHILRNLRKPGETGYKIPRGGLFEYVSAANYAAESCEWIGFAIAANTFPACKLLSTVSDAHNLKMSQTPLQSTHWQTWFHGAVLIINGT